LSGAPSSSSILPRGTNDHVFTHTMTLYNSHTAIPEIRDWGSGKVSATYLAATGKREALGQGDRRAAREAIEAPRERPLGDRGR
jgi:hypothetical protein